MLVLLLTNGKLLGILTSECGGCVRAGEMGEDTRCEFTSEFAALVVVALLVDVGVPARKGHFSLDTPNVTIDQLFIVIF